jgi:hypothetical protein
MALLQDVAVRIVARWLAERGKLDVQVTAGREAVAGRGVDITYAWQGARMKIKVKPDPYFGSDAAKIADRSLSFYRADASAYAFESIANSATREPGWVSDSVADELYYYRITLGHTEEEVQALMNEPDPVFFSELWVDRDELVTMPMAAARTWFESHADNYQARPVISGGVAAWYRLVPRQDVDGAVPDLTVVGPIFRTLKP